MDGLCLKMQIYTYTIPKKAEHKPTKTEGNISTMLHPLGGMTTMMTK
jgi:hypothetical protein